PTPDLSPFPTRRSSDLVPDLDEDRLRRGARDAPAAPDGRDLGVLPAGGGRAPTIRAGRARGPALVGPPRGFPHRGARAGEGADGDRKSTRLNSSHVSIS